MPTAVDLLAPYGTIRDPQNGDEIARVFDGKLAVTLFGDGDVIAASSIIGAASTNATVVKASAGVIAAMFGMNTDSSGVFLKVYNKATTPDENDTPALRGYLPAGSGFIIPLPAPLVMDTGISYRLTGAILDNDTTVITANKTVFNVLYA